MTLFGSEAAGNFGADTPQRYQVRFDNLAVSYCTDDPLFLARVKAAVADLRP